MSKIFYDTEFLEEGDQSPLMFISIGMVAEDGRELYLINDEADWSKVRAHEWLNANVMPFIDKNENALWVDKTQAQFEIYQFLMSTRKNRKDWPELYAWFSSYDHVILAQIFGRMIDLPAGIPMYTHDVRSMADWFGVKSWPKQVGGNHDALEDARHLRKVYDHILEVGKLKNETS